MLDRDLYAEIAFSDFVVAGSIVFHEHISFNLKSAHVGSLEDFFQIAKIVRQSRQNSIALLDDVTVLKRFKIYSDGCLVYIFSFLSNRNEAVHVLGRCQHIV